jgi:hypothetical protein
MINNTFHFRLFGADTRFSIRMRLAEPCIPCGSCPLR